MTNTLTIATCIKIRKLLASRFGSGIFNVTSIKRSHRDIGTIYIKFPNKKVVTSDVLRCLRDNGYDHFVVSSAIKTDVILSGYVSESNYSLATFA